MYDQWSFKIQSTVGVIIHLLLIDLPKDLFRWLTLREKCVRGQTIVITGGGSGLGRRMAQILALEKGAKIAIIDMNLKAANETVSSIKKMGYYASAYECDIRCEQQLNELAKQIEIEFGHVDIVICNAAVLSFAFFMDLSSEQLRQSIDVNVLGTINTIRAFLGKMEERNTGHIVCVSSIAGFSGETYGLAYCASKFAVRGVMECLQMELRDRGLEGIVCTTLCPYFARTPMVLNAGMRPTCTWFPFMSIDSCSRRMVDAILKEKSLAFMPNYVTLVPLIKGLLSFNTARSLREYLNIKYEPQIQKSCRKTLPIMTDYYRSPSLLWWIIIPTALIINFLAWYNPLVLNTSFLPMVGPFATKVGTNHHWITVITNILAFVAHFGESIYAIYLCDEARLSFACSVKWFAQTFILGFPSLNILINYVKKQGKL